MAGNETSQHHLEELRGILAEFYGTADAARHKELDQMLAQFKLHPESWRHCQYFLSVSQLRQEQSGQYVLFFSVPAGAQILGTLAGGSGAAACV
jgi:hypothetical protein